MKVARKLVMRCPECMHTRSHHYDPITRGGDRDILCHGQVTTANGGQGQCRCALTQAQVEMAAATEKGGFRGVVER